VPVILKKIRLLKGGNECGVKSNGGRKIADEKTIRIRRRVGRNWFSIGAIPKRQPSLSRITARKERKECGSWSRAPPPPITTKNAEM
jgi:hypothetical protein